MQAFAVSDQDGDAPEREPPACAHAVPVNVGDAIWNDVQPADAGTHTPSARDSGVPQGVLHMGSE